MSDDATPMLDDEVIFDDEVVEGSPMGGDTCEDSSPEPMIHPSVELDDIDDVEQGDHYPFESLAVELYEAPDEENASAAPQQKESEELPVIQNTQEAVQNVQETIQNTQKPAQSTKIVQSMQKAIQNTHKTVQNMQETVSEKPDPVQNTQEAVSTSGTQPFNGQESVLSVGNLLTETSKSCATVLTSNSIATAENDTYQQTNVEMKDISEPDYSELQKNYIKDFYCIDENAGSFKDPCDTEELKGLQLVRFPKIAKAVETSDYETLQTLYQLLYQRSAWDFKEILVQRILGFSGFNFGKNSEDYFNREMMLRTLPDSALIKIAMVLGMDQVNLLMLNYSKNKMDLISRILEFLSKPQKKSRGPRIVGMVEEDNVENSSSSQNEKCGCRNRCLLKFSENDKKNLLNFLQLLREKRMFDSYIVSLMTCKKIIRKPSEECKKLKEVLYTYKVKMGNKEINACKGGFCILHGIKLGNLNQLQNKLKTGKKLPPKLKVDLMPPIPMSEIPDTGESSDKGPAAKIIKKQSPIKNTTSEDQNPESTTPTPVVNSEIKEQLIVKVPKVVVEKFDLNTLHTKPNQVEEDNIETESEGCVSDESEKEVEDKKTKLKDFSLVVKSIENAPEELLIDIHFLLFLNSADVDKVKDNILEFSGFTFETDTEDYDERNEFLQRMSNKIVADVARSFSLGVLASKQDTIKNILSFLHKPDESYLRTTASVPILSDVEFDDIDDLSDSDVSITCEVVEKKVECIDLISSGEDSGNEEKTKSKTTPASKPKSVPPPAKSVPPPAKSVPPPAPKPTVSQAQKKPPASTPQTENTSSPKRALKDFETICKIVNTHPHEYLIDIYELLYMKKHEPSTLRTDILSFTGFTFEKGSGEYIRRKQLLDRMLYNSVRRIYNTLIHNTAEVKVFSKPTMIGEIFQFLFKLPVLDTTARQNQNKPQIKTVVKPNPVSKQPSPVSVGVTPVPAPPINIPQGKLSDLKRVFQRVACFPCEYLTDVHKLLFMTDCDSKVIRQNIFGFKGFSFSADSPEFQQRKMYLEYLTFHSLRKISSVLTTRSVDLRNSTKHELATHLTQVLAEYTNAYVETEPIGSSAANVSENQQNSMTDLSTSEVENIVVTPILEPLTSSPPISVAPTSEALSTISSSSDPKSTSTKNKTTSSCDTPALSISIVDARSISTNVTATTNSIVSTTTVNTDSSTRNRRKRKLTTDSPSPAPKQVSKISPPKKIAPVPETNQFADINLPEVEQYRQLYKQLIIDPTMPTMTGITTIGSPGVVQQISHLVPQTLPFALAYPQQMQVQAPFPTPQVLGIQPQIEASTLPKVSAKPNEVIVPVTIESDDANSKNTNAATKEISLTAEEKSSKINRLSEDAKNKSDEEDCDKPLASLIGHPIDSVLKKQILDIVKDTNLQDITINGVIQKIYNMYPKFDLSYRKEFIKSTLRSILYKLGDQATNTEKQSIRETNSPDCSVSTTNIPDIAGDESTTDTCTSN